MKSIMQTFISLALVSLPMVGIGIYTGRMPGMANFAFAFSIYAALRANQEE